MASTTLQLHRPSGAAARGAARSPAPRFRSAFSPGFAARPAAKTRGARHHDHVVRVVAYRESEKATDWRVADMRKMAHAYFADFLSGGDASLAAALFDEEVLHVDQCWDPVHPAVGVKGMEHYLHDLKAAFPDFYCEIKELATCDKNCIWVNFEGSATGLGTYHGHKGTHHANVFSGVNLFRFNADRSKITEIRVYRSAFAEDLQEMSEGGFRELRLKRLV